MGQLLFLFLGMFGLELFYLKVADHFNIIDRPNQRSSHSIPTIRGGGVIFVLAILGFSIFMDIEYWPLALAVLLSGAISFIDDLKSLPTWLRAGFHFLSVSIIWYFLDGFSLNFLWFPLFVVIAIGTVNAYNFMDGINGITGWYSLSIAIPLLFLTNDFSIHQPLMWVSISLLVFNFFNSRRKARCFAGDVGSVGIAMLLIYFVLQQILITGNWSYIFLFGLYGIDTIFTIIQRLFEKENIFEAHRKHLYQYLANELQWPHLFVSAIYFILQTSFNVFLIFYHPNLSILAILVSIQALVYIFVKRWIYVNKIRLKLT